MIDSSTALLEHGYLYIDRIWVSGKETQSFEMQTFFSTSIDAKVQMLLVTCTLPE